MLDLSEKLKIAMIKTKTTQSDLATRTGQTQANLANKLIRNNFKLSEFEKLADALGCVLEISLTLPNGEKI